MSTKPGPDHDLPDLLARLAAGDEAAARELLPRYLDLLRDYVHQKAGRELLAREASVDLVQSVCREVLEDARNGGFAYRDEGQFRAFLFQAALNKVRSKGRFHGRQRRSARQEVSPQGLSPSVAEALFQTLHTPSQLAAANEERERFLLAFTSLPQEQQQLIQWARIDGLSHREIGARLGISEGNSRVQLARALARLATLAGGPEDRP